MSEGTMYNTPFSKIVWIGMRGTKNVTWQTLMSKFEDHGPVQWVEVMDKKEMAAVFYQSTRSAKDAYDKWHADGPTINGEKILVDKWESPKTTPPPNHSKKYIPPKPPAVPRTASRSRSPPQWPSFKDSIAPCIIQTQ